VVLFVHVTITELKAISLSPLRRGRLEAGGSPFHRRPSDDQLTAGQQV
jgi:hypothetical protein